MKWPILRLEQLAAPEPASIKIGPFGSQLKKSELVSSGIHVLGIENVLASSFDGLGSRYVTDEKFDTLRPVEVKPGDILITMMGTIGAVCVVPQGIATSIMDSHLLRFRPNPLMCRPAYVAWLIKGGSTIRDFLSARAHGSIMLGLNSGIVRALPAPLPPLCEQDRIVKLLNEGDKLRELGVQADRRTADLIPALFHEMFGDPVTNNRNWKRGILGDLLDGIDGGWSPTCQDRPAQPDEWGVLKLGAVTTCEYIDTENKALLDNFTPRPGLEVKTGDLLFTRKNTYELVAACAFVFETRPNLMLSDLIFRFRLKPNAQLNPVFLWGLLTYPSKRNQVQTLAGGSAGSMPNISKGRLVALPIEVPPMPVQKEFARAVTEIRELEAKQTASRERVDALFRSMLHHAFRGEL